MNRHLLTDTPQGDAGPDEMLEVIRGLGFVQLDSINTVARAHDSNTVHAQSPLHANRIENAIRARSRVV